MDAGDSLVIGYSAHGSLSGHAWAIASIVDRNGNSGLNYSILCTVDDGCSKPLDATFLITASYDDEIFEIVPQLEVYTTLADASSGADWFHSLGVTFTAPPDATVVDSIGIIQTPEPSSAVLIGGALARVAAKRRMRDALPA